MKPFTLYIRRPGANGWSLIRIVHITPPLEAA